MGIALLQQAGDLAKKGNFDEAVTIYEEYLRHSQTAMPSWDARSYANCLRKLKRNEACIAFAKKQLEAVPDFAPLRNELGWALYDQYIKSSDIDEKTFFRTAEEIVRISDTGNRYSALKRTVFKVLDYCKNRPDPNYESMLNWLDQLPMDQLKEDEETFRAADGTDRALASEVERYYALKIECLLKLNQYAECCDAVDAAMAKVKKFHYDNDIWFKRSYAIALKHLDRASEAEGIYKQLLIKRKEWFMLKELAELYKCQGNTREAIRAAADAALAPGDVEKKVQLFALLAELLNQEGETDAAARHISLSYVIRVEKGWTTPPRFMEQVKKYGIDIENLPSAITLYRSMIPYWEQCKYRGQELLKGRIESLLPNGKAGFIRASTGKQHYFKVASVTGPRHMIKEGKDVTFYLEEGYDSKKNQSTWNAVNIKFI